MNKGYLILFVLGIFLFASCGQGKKEAQLAEEAELDSLLHEDLDTLDLFDEVEPPKAVDELFDDFFFTFASDARFQNLRIRFPLHFKDEDTELTLSKEDWHRYNRFDQQEFFSVIYEREQDLALQKDTAVHEVSVQWIYLKDGYVEKFNFKRIPEGQWVLFDIEKQEISETANGDFVHFYSEFVSDSIFQRTSLKYPLTLIVPEEEEEGTKETHISADEWFEMRGDMPLPSDVLVNIDYGQQCSETSHKNVLMEGVCNGLFMNFKFEKTTGEWKLVGIEL